MLFQRYDTLTVKNWSPRLVRVFETLHTHWYWMIEVVSGQWLW